MNKRIRKCDNFSNTSTQNQDNILDVQVYTIFVKICEQHNEWGKAGDYY